MKFDLRLFTVLYLVSRILCCVSVPCVIVVIFFSFDSSAQTHWNSRTRVTWDEVRGLDANERGKVFVKLCERIGTRLESLVLPSDDSSAIVDWTADLQRIADVAPKVSAIAFETADHGGDELAKGATVPADVRLARFANLRSIDFGNALASWTVMRSVPSSVEVRL